MKSTVKFHNPQLPGRFDEVAGVTGLGKLAGEGAARGGITHPNRCG